ncbi:hypothetical protein QBC32DRAFT_348844 [Pseudoneurospora amorphoporcata]|uniref:Uncharacterized protein n=1 Tax=Pseudoneurospora amorphoporcata TaxID=241081 RepID=A0AAN6NTC7_9PEZI|nr:hypothetical protein QBC32DRAFT_348844 [Pseudoneurospora amorphoporcata]
MSSAFIRCWRDLDDEQGTRLYYNITIHEWNCADHLWICDSCPPLQADPDIAGIGVGRTIETGYTHMLTELQVFAAFMVDVFMTFVLGILFPVLASVQPRKSPAKNTTSMCADLHKRLGRFVANRIGEEHAVKWAKICYSMLVCLGDQQLATSIALLVATVKLHIDESLSVYHFNLLVQLVFFSSTAFTYTIISYRIWEQWDPTRENNDHRDEGASLAIAAESDPKPQQRAWGKRLRKGLPWAVPIVLILTLDVLLLYSGYASARAGPLNKKCPAICFRNVSAFSDAQSNQTDTAWWKTWVMNSWSHVLMSASIHYIQLALAHNWWLPTVPVWRNFGFKMKLTLPIFQCPACSSHGSSQTWRMIVVVQQVCIAASWYYAIVTRAVCDFVWAFTATAPGSLVWITVWFDYHCVFPLREWESEHHVQSANGAYVRDETSMGFGQVVPILLLILPVLQLVDSVSGT